MTSPMSVESSLTKHQFIEHTAEVKLTKSLTSVGLVYPTTIPSLRMSIPRSFIVMIIYREL